MIARVTRAKEGFAEYMITGARKDSVYIRDQKDKTITLYGNLKTFKQTEKYLNKYKKKNEILKELAHIYIKHHTSGYDIENEVIAYAEKKKKKIQTNEKGQ